MRPENLQITLRERGSYEAIDMGFALIRTYWRPIFLSWFTIVAPLYFIVWFLFRNNIGWAIFFVWWLKPLWDRVPHFVLSRMIFGEKPTPWQVIKGKFWQKRLFRNLFFGRFSSLRSLLISVDTLEELKGSANSQRAKTLARNARSAAFMLFFLSFFIEIIVVFGIIGCIDLMIPYHQEFTFSALTRNIFRDPTGFFVFLTPTIMFLALSFAEPLYVAAGFGLYLNRRTQLEGWDLQISFQKIADARRKKTKKNAKKQTFSPLSHLLILSFFFSTFFFSRLSYAQTEQTPSEVIREVLQRDDFGHNSVERKIWRLRRSERRERRREPRTRTRTSNSRNEISATGNAISAIVEIILWIVIAIVVSYFLFILAKMVINYKSNKKQKTLFSGRTTKGLQQMEIPQPELTEDQVVLEAWRLWNEKAFAEAIGVIYHGTIQRITPSGESLNSFTESDWIQFTRHELTREKFIHFERLVSVWMKTAYAHHTPENTLMTELIAIWKQFIENEK